ncbi:unnamed protein product [Rhizoctonia solani]|uniref:Uncharacterized protein n=1 Tax=Rhizoctonia solani TaxID=456999 RepID=A0A8H3BAF6_9AGAM|nr:unnamed protein product [Rhizoctonia solani]
MGQSRRLSHDPYKLSRLDISRKELVRHESSYKEATSQEYYRKLKHPGSEWILLFYDLAWTATFAALAQNGKFIEPMEVLSYFAFFAAVLWLWASQTLYSIHFYTNDWFHFTSIFLQLFIFGMLAATTKGYDITAYISHTPGSDELNPDVSQLTGADELKMFADEKTDLLSARMIALTFALTRFLHLVQYLRACYYARWGKGYQHRKNQAAETWGTFIHDFVHPQLYAIVIGLIFSNMILFAVVGIVFSDFGTTVLGSSLKVGLWVGGFLLEILSHIWHPILLHMHESRPKREVHPLPVGEVDLSKRLDTITTIILGEANAGRAIAVNVVSAAFIIWFIAYIYFEGPTSGSNPKGEGVRRMLWMVFYLPLLASIFLLLVGIKNQFVITTFLSTVKRSTHGFREVLIEANFPKNITNTSLWESKSGVKNFLFARGIIWADEYKNLRNSMTTAEEWPVNFDAWLARLSLTMVLKSTNNDDIPDAAQTLIDKYYQADKATIAQDSKIQDPRESMYYQILTELLKGSLDGVRYILVFAAVILLSLGLQSLIHSCPSDRYQWGVIMCRLLMGLVLALLLLLNLGKYQEYFVLASETRQRAGVFQWLEVFWVLPTIAIAYGVQFIIEVCLTFFGKLSTRKPAAPQQPTAINLPYQSEPVQNDDNSEGKV